MPLIIVKNDITTMEVDAIVNPTDSYFSAGGGVDRQVHMAAGGRLREELCTYGLLGIGNTVITDGYDLKAKKIIHVAGPIWNGGTNNEKLLLMYSYLNCLQVAKNNNIKTIAFPLISTGTFKFPKELGIDVATKCFKVFLEENEMTIYLVVYDKESIAISEKLLNEINNFIDENLEESTDSMSCEYSCSIVDNEELDFKKENRTNSSEFTEKDRVFVSYAGKLDKVAKELQDIMGQYKLEETFAQKLFKIIDEKGMTDPEVYKKANLDRRLFSRIRSNINYKPTKKTAIALCLALQLDYDETQDLLSRTNLVLNRNNQFDLTIEYCIRKGIFDIFSVDQILYSLDLELLSNY